MCQGGEQHAVAHFQRLERARDAQVGLPDSWGAKKHNIGLRFDEGEVGQFPELPLIDPWLKREIERFQRFARRQACRFQAIVLGSQLAAFDLHQQDPAQERLVGQAVQSRLLVEVGQPHLHVREAQGLQ